MVCNISCAISAIFIISSIYMSNATNSSEVIKKYKEQLSDKLKKVYEKITEERKNIYYQGFALGLLFSLLIIFYNNRIKQNKLSSIPMTCIIISTCFITNYFYYTLAPKKDYMLNHITGKEETKAWLEMYKQMQFYYHSGLVLGIIGVGILGFAFRC